MSRFFNIRQWAGWMFGLGLALVAPSAAAFSMLGPGESWQDITMGYQKFHYITYPSSGWVIHGNDFAWHPQNWGEEFRWNNKVLYYACDQSFLDYFGAEGVAAVDAAVAVFNNLPNASDADLNQFPLEASRINYTAAALHLYDLKSTIMELLIERLGLIDPERWTWCIRARVLPPSLACPQFDFAVVQRNFDPVTGEPTRYVNGTLFTYGIQQICTPYDFGDAVEFLVDPHADASARYSALATPKLTLPDETFYGWFHTGLTRDDMGGLRHLYRTNNINLEGSGTNAVTYVVDTSLTNLLFMSNLTFLASQAITNDAATLQALFPGLSIASSIPIFTNVYVTNITAYFTNYPFDPVGTPQHLEFATNRTLTVQTWYRHTFNNLATVKKINNTWTVVPLPEIADHTNTVWLAIETTAITNAPWSPAGSPLVTNTHRVVFPTNIVSGQYFILPTNMCGVSIAQWQATLTNYYTNALLSATNTPTGDTNTPAGNTNTFNQVVIERFIHDVFQINPVVCLSNSIGLRQGIEKVTFIRRDYDSLIGQFYSPITNNYTLTLVTNELVGGTNRTILIPQQVRRVVTAPDILFTAADLAGSMPSIPTVTRSTPSFDLTGAQPGLAGPGVIRGPVSFQFNKVGPIYLNGTYPLFVDEFGALLNFTWASFDASTNAPIIYPSGTSLASLENQVLVQVSPPYLPDAVTGSAYSAQLYTSAATPNWQTPITWSLAAGSPALPPGLTLSSGGHISGTPGQMGFFNFIVVARDAAGRTVQQSYVINVAASP